jgi:hypothetical protein
MTKRAQSKDVIQRQGLLRHFQREHLARSREFDSATTANARWVLRGRLLQIEQSVEWVKKQLQRSTRRGGLGK